MYEVRENGVFVDTTIADGFSSLGTAIEYAQNHSKKNLKVVNSKNNKVEWQKY